MNADGTDERAGVFLTNALTGWEPPKEPKSGMLPFPEFEQERDAADHVKQTQKIIVILGNPPYDAYSGVALGEENDLVTPYKKGLGKTWGIKKFNLDDLYVRFFRLAERRIAEQNGRGVVCLITNSSYISGDSFVVMREHIIGNFDKIWIDNLNGDSRETGKTTPEGLPDPSVFSTPYNREGIKKGTAVALLVCNHAPGPLLGAAVHHRDWWGANKRIDLLNSADDADALSKYSLATPAASNRFSLRPGQAGLDYATWPLITDLVGMPLLHGPVERRAEALIDIDREVLIARLKLYFDQKVSFNSLPIGLGGLKRVSSGFEPQKMRNKALKSEKFSDGAVLPYLVRPFDRRWCYFAQTNGIWSRPSKPLEKQCGGNYFLGTRPSGVIDPEGFPFVFSSILPDYQAAIRNISYVPFVRKLEIAADLLGAESVTWRANLSDAAREYLVNLDFPDPDSDREAAEIIWMHALAIGYSPAYIKANAVGIRENWPRIPLPATREALVASALLGRQVAALLDTESKVSGVTSGGTIRPELRTVAVVSRLGGGALQPHEFAVSAGWGSEGKSGVTMPGRGRSQSRPTSSEEQCEELGSSETTLDVFLNDTAYWRNIPEAVWAFTVGGYQVMKKWLSYREDRVLGRALHMSEIMEFTAMARRVSAIVLLQPALDANYKTVSAATSALSMPA